MQKQTCYIWQQVPPDLPNGMYTVKLKDKSNEEIFISHIERFYNNWMFDDNGNDAPDNFEVIAYQEETEAYISTERTLEEETIIQKIKFPVYYDNSGQLILDADGKMICDIRGWGWIQYLPEAEKLQDVMGYLIANKINELQ